MGPTPSFDIKRNGRAFAYDMDDLEDAENRIVNDRHFDPDKDRVILLGTDGYRTRCLFARAADGRKIF